MHKQILVLILCAVSAVVARASDDLWVGTWKLDPAQSHFVASTFTYSQTPDGMYHYSEGPKSTYTSFRIDGQEYKTDGTSTSTWTATGDNAWDTIHKTNGVVVERVHRELSPDRKTFNMVAEGSQPDGATFKVDLVYKRVGEGTGLLGKWASTKVESSVPDTILILPSPEGMYHWEAPAYKVTMEGKLDGSDTPITGPLVPPGSAVTIRRITAHRLLHTSKMNGIVTNEGVQTLASDGKSFTDVTWVPGKRSERSTGVYVRQ